MEGLPLPVIDSSLSMSPRISNSISLVAGSKSRRIARISPGVAMAGNQLDEADEAKQSKTL